MLAVTSCSGQQSVTTLEQRWVQVSNAWWQNVLSTPSPHSLSRLQAGFWETKDGTISALRPNSLPRRTSLFCVAASQLGILNSPQGTPTAKVNVCCVHGHPRHQTVFHPPSLLGPGRSCCCPRLSLDREQDFTLVLIMGLIIRQKY